MVSVSWSFVKAEHVVGVPKTFSFELGGRVYNLTLHTPEPPKLDTAMTAEYNNVTVVWLGNKSVTVHVMEVGLRTLFVEIDIFGIPTDTYSHTYAFENLTNIRIRYIDPAGGAEVAVTENIKEGADRARIFVEPLNLTIEIPIPEETITT